MATRKTTSPAAGARPEPSAFAEALAERLDKQRNELWNLQAALSCLSEAMCGSGSGIDGVVNSETVGSFRRVVDLAVDGIERITAAL